MSIKLTWQVKRESGRPLAAADIDHYVLVVTLDGVSQPATAPNPGDLAYIYAATAPGLYGFGLVCVPKKGEQSDPATGSIQLSDETKVDIFDLTIEVIAP